MRSIETLKKSYGTLAIDLYKLYRKMCEKRDDFNFLTDKLRNWKADEDTEEKRIEVLKEAGELDCLPQIERRNTINGKTHDCYVTSIYTGTIFVIDAETQEGKTIGFTEIQSVYDQIHLIEKMKELC